jgi:hypothetical protein
MSKQQYFMQKSIQDAQSAATNYLDDHYNEFTKLLFDELLCHIQNVNFDDIIRYDLSDGRPVHGTREVNGLRWLWTADRLLINGRTIYSFRFPNASHPELYQSFNTTTHSLFQSIGQKRHGLDGWYRYTGENAPGAVDAYLAIQKVLHTGTNHTTKIFVNQAKERLDIEFNLQSTREQITITFERGTPTSDSSSCR